MHRILGSFLALGTVLGLLALPAGASSGAESQEGTTVRPAILGTQDAAPALQLAAEVLTASRPATTFTHYSADRQLASPSTNIQVQVVVAQWDAANHTLACALTSGGTTYTPSVTTSKLEPDGEATRITFTFAPNPALSTYRVKLSGSRNAAANPFVVVERTDVSL